MSNRLEKIPTKNVRPTQSDDANVSALPSRATSLPLPLGISSDVDAVTAGGVLQLGTTTGGSRPRQGERVPDHAGDEFPLVDFLPTGCVAEATKDSTSSLSHPDDSGDVALERLLGLRARPVPLRRALSSCSSDGGGRGSPCWGRGLTPTAFSGGAFGRTPSVVMRGSLVGFGGGGLPGGMIMGGTISSSPRGGCLQSGGSSASFPPPMMMMPPRAVSSGPFFGATPSSLLPPAPPGPPPSFPAGPFGAGPLLPPLSAASGGGGSHGTMVPPFGVSRDPSPALSSSSSGGSADFSKLFGCSSFGSSGAGGLGTTGLPGLPPIPGLSPMNAGVFPGLSPTGSSFGFPPLPSKAADHRFENAFSKSALGKDAVSKGGGLGLTEGAGMQLKKSFSAEAPPNGRRDDDCFLSFGFKAPPAPGLNTASGGTTSYEDPSPISRAPTTRQLSSGLPLYPALSSSGCRGRPDESCAAPPTSRSRPQLAAPKTSSYLAKMNVSSFDDDDILSPVDHHRTKHMMEEESPHKKGGASAKMLFDPMAAYMQFSDRARTRRNAGLTLHGTPADSSGEESPNSSDEELFGSFCAGAGDPSSDSKKKKSFGGLDGEEDLLLTAADKKEKAQMMDSDMIGDDDIFGDLEDDDEPEPSCDDNGPAALAMLGGYGDLVIEKDITKNQAVEFFKRYGNFTVQCVDDWASTDAEAIEWFLLRSSKGGESSSIMAVTGMTYKERCDKTGAWKSVRKSELGLLKEKCKKGASPLGGSHLWAECKKGTSPLVQGGTSPLGGSQQPVKCGAGTSDVGGLNQVEVADVGGAGVDHVGGATTTSGAASPTSSKTAKRLVLTLFATAKGWRRLGLGEVFVWFLKKYYYRQGIRNIIVPATNPAVPFWTSRVNGCVSLNKEDSGHKGGLNYRSCQLLRLQTKTWKTAVLRNLAKEVMLKRVCYATLTESVRFSKVEDLKRVVG